MARFWNDNRGRWRTLTVVALLVAHGAALIWLGAQWKHLRVMMYSLHEVPSEAAFDVAPAFLTRQFPYVEDPLEELGRFTTVATPLIAGANSAPERARLLGDYLYGLRASHQRGFEEDLRNGPDALLDLMLDGQQATCGQASVVFATLWRSLGGHSQMVRWSNSAGDEGHYSVSLWDEARGRWFYYDVNLNGFFMDDASGRPLSVSEVRASVLKGTQLTLVGHPTLHYDTVEVFRYLVSRFPVELLVLNNNYMRWSPQQRFGQLNSYYDTLSALPRPWDRFMDNLTGHRDRRMAVAGRIRVGGLLSPGIARAALLYLLAVTFVTLLTLVRRLPERRQRTRFSL